jgi:putative ABC transport system permease protein
MWTFRRDVSYTLRGMLRTPAFTAVILATLALGIGANVAIFSVVNGILLRPLPFREPERIVAVAHKDPYWTVSEPEFVDYQRDGSSLSRLAAYTAWEANLTGGDEPERVGASRVSEGFFAIFGLAPQLGRVFAPEEELPGGQDVVVISDGLWRRYFGADHAIIGKTLMLNEVPRTVIGVMPQRFDYPTPSIAVWTPLRLNRDSLWTRNNHYLQLVGQLAPGVSLAQSQAELTTLALRFTRDYPETYFPGKPLVPEISPLRERLLGSTRPYLLALVGAVGFVLLIACVNVANLLLARGETRRKELAIRAALGASAARLTRQLLTESALLALAGGMLGLALAWWGVRLLIALAPSSIPRLGDVHVDLPVLAFTVTLSILTGLLFGLAPAVRAVRADSADTLKEGGKTSAIGGGLRHARRALVVSEVALAVITLAGAGLLVRSLWKLQAIDLGFDPTAMLTMRLSLPTRSYDEARAVEFYRELSSRVEHLTGVRSVAATGALPLASGDDIWSIFVDGHVAKAISEAPSAKPHQVTPGYFGVMGIPILRGRAFTAADREDAPPVTIVDETMARQLWPGQDPLGHTLKMFSDSAPWVTVVGVARNVRSGGFQTDAPPTMYFPHAQAGRSAYGTPRTMTLVVKTTGDPLTLTGAVRRVVRELGPTVPISQTQSMEQVIGASIASRRFTTTMLGAFAALALVLAGIGIYGVIAYGVSQRTSEIGLRMALGAERRSVLLLVLSDGLQMTLLGLALGLAGALAVARLLRSLLVGVSAVDVPTLAIVSLALVGVALLASALPARRAMSVSPTEALRGG